MRVLCGTDFSDRCEAAGTLGALLAKRSGGDLTLVHVLDTRSIALGPAAVLEALDQSAREKLERTAERLRGLGARVSVELPAGWPDEALLAEAKRHDDALLILPAIGRRDGAGVRLGKTCERALRATESPMLVLRDAAPLIAWLRGERRLRMLIAYDFTPQADAAVLFAERLAELGGCHPIAAYVDDPRREAARMGLLDSPDQSQQRLRDEIARRLARLADAPFIKVEATKFTEVGYVGKDVDTIVRDLVEIAVKQEREAAMRRHRTRAAGSACWPTTPRWAGSCTCRARPRHRCTRCTCG